MRARAAVLAPGWRRGGRGPSRSRRSGARDRRRSSSASTCRRRWGRAGRPAHRRRREGRRRRGRPPRGRSCAARRRGGRRARVQDDERVEERCGFRSRTTQGRSVRCGCALDGGGRGAQLAAADRLWWAATSGPTLRRDPTSRSPALEALPTAPILRGYPRSTARSRSVVAVRVRGRQGSGVVYEKRRIVTNHHVVPTPATSSWSSPAARGWRRASSPANRPRPAGGRPRPAARCPISPGNSGGALVGPDGKVIGVNVAGDVIIEVGNRRVAAVGRPFGHAQHRSRRRRHVDDAAPRRSPQPHRRDHVARTDHLPCVGGVRRSRRSARMRRTADRRAPHHRG